MMSVNKNRDGEPRQLRARVTRGRWTWPSSDRKCRRTTKPWNRNKWRRGLRRHTDTEGSLGCRRTEWTRWTYLVEIVCVLRITISLCGILSNCFFYFENKIQTFKVLCFIFFYQSAVGSNYVANVEKHSSQTDAAKGFGGKYGVQKDRQDKVCYPQNKWLRYFLEEGDQ